LASIAQRTKSALEKHYGERQSLHSSDPRACLIEELRQTSPEVAAYALWFFLGRTLVNGERECFEGACRAVLFEIGLRDTAEGQKAALESLLVAWRDRHNEARAECEQLRADRDAARGEHKAQLAQQQKQFETTRSEWTQNFEALREVYKEQMKLRFPVKYWSNRAWWHAGLGVVFGLACVTIFAALGWVLFYEINAWVFPPAEQVDQVMQNERLGFDYRGIAVFLVSATLGLLLLRVAVRLLMSNVHLQAMARERATMAMTYLALFEDGKVEKDEDRQLILQALFRPSSTGLIQGEETPTSVYEAAVRLFAGSTGRTGGGVE